MAESCNYFEKLLESNNCQPFDYNEYLAELPSTKQFFTAQQSADQMFNAEIRKSVLSEIEIPFAEVCKHIPCSEYTPVCPFVHDQLCKTKEQILDIECNTQGQSDNSLWFEERQLRMTASNFSLVLKHRESIFSKSILAKHFTAAASKKANTPKPSLWGQSTMNKMPSQSI